jgi:hypothetical protein
MGGVTKWLGGKGKKNYDGEIERRAPRNLLLVGGHADDKRVPPAAPPRRDRRPRDADAEGAGRGGRGHEAPGGRHGESSRELEGRLVQD